MLNHSAFVPSFCFSVGSTVQIPDLLAVKRPIQLVSLFDKQCPNWLSIKRAVVLEQYLGGIRARKAKS